MQNRIKKFFGISVLCLSLFGCFTDQSSSTYYTSQQKQERRIMWQMERQLNHERIIADCQMYNSCKGNYRIYNSDPSKRYD